MAAIIASGVCRYSVNGSYQGHDVVNIVDMKIDTTGTPSDRGVACFDQAGIIINEWSDSILTKLAPQYSALSVSWVDLDDAEGSTGERSTTSEDTWPQTGGNASSAFPGNVALRVNKNIIAKRGQRQGRMYLCGIAEGFSSTAEPNMIVPGNVAELNTALASFLGDINQEQGGGVGTSYSSEMVVLHTAAGLYTDFSVVQSLTCDQYLASQVRRIRR
jgi:hypothetical protein